MRIPILNLGLAVLSLAFTANAQNICVDILSREFLTTQILRELEPALQKNPATQAVRETLWHWVLHGYQVEPNRLFRLSLSLTDAALTRDIDAVHATLAMISDLQSTGGVGRTRQYDVRLDEMVRILRALADPTVLAGLHSLDLRIPGNAVDVPPSKQAREVSISDQAFAQRVGGSWRQTDDGAVDFAISGGGDIRVRAPDRIKIQHGYDQAHDALIRTLAADVMVDVIRANLGEKMASTPREVGVRERLSEIVDISFEVQMSQFTGTNVPREVKLAVTVTGYPEGVKPGNGAVAQQVFYFDANVIGSNLIRPDLRLIELIEKPVASGP